MSRKFTHHPHHHPGPMGGPRFGGRDVAGREFGGPDAAGPGFDGPGFGGPGFGGPGGRRGRGGPGRAPRGDVRLAVLTLLTEEPMHGYQLMQAISDRSNGRWSPSPGAIYPTLSQLEDEGLVSVTADAGRKLATLTNAGRRAVEEMRANRPDPFAGFAADGPGTDLHAVVEQLIGAVRQVRRSGTEAQAAGAARILNDARKSLYLLLAEDPPTTGA